ncbi:MAG: hypothetical protein WD251_01885, partial [Saccharospirillum sp.]
GHGLHHCGCCHHQCILQSWCTLSPVVNKSERTLSVKTIGLLGGMTQAYYRLLNENVKSALGGLHSAKVILYSVDFAEIEALQHRGQ